jgi:hypothetical protein
MAENETEQGVPKGLLSQIVETRERVAVLNDKTLSFESRLKAIEEKVAKLSTGLKEVEKNLF